jgi:hypothetical protein
MMHYRDEFFTYDQVATIINIGKGVDGTHGGLILGPSHEDGGIYVLRNVGYGYKLTAEVEGYEYFFNPGATIYYKNIFQQFNRPQEHAMPKFEKYAPPAHIKIIDARLLGATGEKKFIIMDDRYGFSICNRYSTKIHLDKLDELNKVISFKFDSQTSYSTTKIEIIDANTNQTIFEYKQSPNLLY